MDGEWDEGELRKESSCGLDLMDMELDSFKMEAEEETRRASRKAKYSEVESEYFTPVNAKINAPRDGDYWGGGGKGDTVKEKGNEDGGKSGEKKKGCFANIDSEKWAKLGTQVAFGSLSTGE